MCPLTPDFETHFLQDGTFGVSDRVASLVCARDSTETDVALVDDDPTLVAVPGHARTGQQHQSWSAGGEVKSFLHLPS